MRPTLASTIAVVTTLVVTTVQPAYADATVFLGAQTTPSNRLSRGFAIGFGVLFVGFEFEYASVSEDLDVLAPSLKTGVGNVLLQTPVPIYGFQPYFTTGAGVYRERLNNRQDTDFATNVGGGVKVSLAGPLRARVDYRVFRLGDGALTSPTHRLYGGLNLSF
jgi:opacity protein-like surface antigen